MAGERGGTGLPAATAARRSDSSSVLPWVIGAVVIAALVVAGVWFMSTQDADSHGGMTNDVDVPAAEPGLVEGTSPVPEQGGEDLVDEGETQPLGDDDTGAGMGEEEEGVGADGE